MTAIIRIGVIVDFPVLMVLFSSGSSDALEVVGRVVGSH